MKQKESEVVEIQQVENGYMVHVGSKCEVREMMVFQSFTELVNFLNENFTFRNENIWGDLNNQLSIVLKNK
ncbi:MAG: hypothetical protein ACOVOQ_13970 [Flavobacterium sp.]|jgi:hypothetical protein